MLGLSDRLSKIRASPIRKIIALLEKARNPGIISFGAGAPSLPPPVEIMEECANVSHDPSMYKYGSTMGKQSLRSLISADLNKKGVGVGEDNILITTGCTEGISLTLSAIINPGDEVVLTDPCYLGYPEPAKLSGAILGWLGLSETDAFQPTQEALDKVVNGNTKALILASPDNPTGAVLTKESTKMLADAAVDKGFFIVFDETYRDIIYEGEHEFMFEYAPENTIALFSMSKSASMPGLRVGIAYSDERLIKAMEKIQQYTILCPNTLSQALAKRFYEGNTYQSYIESVVLPTYKERRDVMANALRKYLPRAKFSMPSGAFYFFPDMTDYMGGMSEEEFCNAVLDKAGVVLIPGNYFGNQGGKGHVRMTFVSENPKRIIEGVKRVSEMVL